MKLRNETKYRYETLVSFQEQHNQNLLDMLEQCVGKTANMAKVYEMDNCRSQDDEIFDQMGCPHMLLLHA